MSPLQYQTLLSEIKALQQMVMLEQPKAEWVKLRILKRQAGLTDAIIGKHKGDESFARKTKTGRYEYNVVRYKSYYPAEN